KGLAKKLKLPIMRLPSFLTHRFWSHFNMCGVIGVIGSESPETRSVTSGCTASYETFRGLLALQHRGQDAAGILSYDSKTRMFVSEKDLGLVSHVFDQQKIERLTGHMAIGHTRYATMG